MHVIISSSKTSTGYTTFFSIQGAVNVNLPKSINFWRGILFIGIFQQLFDIHFDKTILCGDVLLI